jgi:hypothetical protein
LINPIAQNTVSVNTSENWTGYVNVFDLAKFLLLDILGEKVKSALINSNNFNVNLSELPNGIYHLELKTDSQIIKSFPVLKQ